MSEEIIGVEKSPQQPPTACSQWEKKLIDDIAVCVKDFNVGNGNVSCRNVHRKNHSALWFAFGILLIALLSYLLAFFYSCYNHTVCIYEFESNTFMKMIYHICKSLGRKESIPI